METVRYSTCEKCRPKKWNVMGEAKHSYPCASCKFISTKILKRREVEVMDKNR